MSMFLACFLPPSHITGKLIVWDVKICIVSTHRQDLLNLIFLFNFQSKYQNDQNFLGLLGYGIMKDM